MRDRAKGYGVAHQLFDLDCGQRNVVLRTIPPLSSCAAKAVRMVISNELVSPSSDTINVIRTAPDLDEHSLLQTIAIISAPKLIRSGR